MKKDIENKNKLRPKTKNKILVLGLILITIIGIGLFSSAGKAQAADCTSYDNGVASPAGCTIPPGSCYDKNNNSDLTLTWGQCKINPGYTWSTSAPGPATPNPVGPLNPGTVERATAAPTTPSNKSDFEKQFDTATICYTGISDGVVNVGGCLVKISYYLFYVIPSWLLALSANFFNAIIAISLSSTLFAKSTFIPTAWAVVRDLSNIFFILILLYIAIQIILDIGGHDAKKMIAKVIIVALLINFSMFFTQVVIDSSNILALIFYNKMDVNTKNADGSTRIYTQITKENEKDMSGAMVNAFNPTSQLNWDNFFKAARTPTATDLGEMGTCKSAGATYQKNKSNCEGWPTFGTWTASLGGVNKDGLFAQIPSGIMLGLILVTGAVMLFAAYAFFIAGISFMGRFIELWILIIFSPFAFMSFSIPLLEKVEYIGWDAWLKRLFAVSFMAPIFMFFMYFIFLLLQPPGLFGNLIVGTGMIQTMLLIIIPAMILLILLLQATKFAKKGSGVLGEKLLAGAKMIGGLALGAATGGAALALTGTAGKYFSNVANNDSLRAQASGDKEHFAKMGITDVNVQKKMQKSAQQKLDRANYWSGKSFDVRQTGLGKFAASKSGMDFNKGTGAIGLSTEKLKGGQKARDKRATEIEEAKVESYKMTKRTAREQDDTAKTHNATASKQNARAAQYEKDKEEAQKWSKEHKTSFDETAFKKAYEEDGGNMGAHGLDKIVTAGSVDKMERMKTSAQVNDDRRKAYADSLNEKNDEAKDAVKTLSNEFWKGAGMSTKGSIAASVVAGLATGGVSTGIQLGAGLARGVAQGLRAGVAKRISDDTKSPFLAALRETVRPYAGPSPEIVATIRREDPNKEMKKILGDLNAGRHVSDENKGKVAEKLKGSDHGGGATTESPPPVAPSH